MVFFGDCNICWIVSAPLCLINCLKMMTECLHATDKRQSPTYPRTQSDLIMLFETDISWKNESRAGFPTVSSSRNGLTWRVGVNLPDLPWCVLQTFTVCVGSVCFYFLKAAAFCGHKQCYESAESESKRLSRRP